MDTIVEIKIPVDESPLSRSEIEKAIDEALSEMRRIYKKYNPHDPASLLSKINNSTEYVLDDETRKLLSYAIQLSNESSGNFDPTIFTLEQKLWSPLIKGKRSSVPSQTEIKSALKSVGVDKIKLNGNNLIKPPDISFDFGAFVKGYAVDCAVSVLKKHNVSSALVNAGGDLSCYGKREWRIAIQHPRSSKTDGNEQKFLGVITISNVSIATSGDYERFVIINGTRYHHIINPATGKPTDASISTTIISDKSCMEADALSTAVFVMGPTKGLDFINSYKNKYNSKIDGLIVSPDGRFFATEGFKKFKLEF